MAGTMEAAAVFFDMDGVLLDSFEAWLAVMNATAKELSHPPVEESAFRAVFGQSTEDDVARFFPGASVSDVEARYASHLPSSAAAVRVNPEAAVVLAGLARRGLATAVVTNTPFEMARAMLEAAGLEPDALVSGADVARPKPAPDIIFRGCEVLGVEPWDVLVIGDSPFDRDAAAAAGVPFAGLGISGNYTLSTLNDVLSVVDGTWPGS